MFVILIVSNSTKANEMAPKTNKVLAGLVIRHGEIIDALQPIYQNINNDGSLGEPYNGKQVGGNGGRKTIVYRNGYVITGFIYSRGYWMGSKRIAGFTPILQRWENGKVLEDGIKVGNFGLVNKISGKQQVEFLPQKGLYLSDVRLNDSDLSELGYRNDGVYLSELRPVFSGDLIKLREAEDINDFVVKNVKDHSTNKSDIATTMNVDDQFYLIKINIISGSKKGQLAEGIVSFLQDATQGIHHANRFILHYDDQCYTIKETGAPKAELYEGLISNLKVVAGPSQHRFGINGGFARTQFRRNSEKFILEGKEYFGYLYPNTIVDGAGTISYQALNNNIQETYNNYKCDVY